MLGVVNKELRASLFHEFHHLVRYAAVPSGSVLDEAISEGMASVLEEGVGPRRPWASYGADAKDWLDENEALPAGTPRKPWFTRHPDGRRWIG